LIEAVGALPFKPRAHASAQYPEIKARVKMEIAEIYWTDEAGLPDDSQYGRGYSIKGKTPVVNLNAKRVSANLILPSTTRARSVSGSLTVA